MVVSKECKDAAIILFIRDFLENFAQDSFLLEIHFSFFGCTLLLLFERNTISYGKAIISERMEEINALGSVYCRKSPCGIDPQKLPAPRGQRVGRSGCGPGPFDPGPSNCGPHPSRQILTRRPSFLREKVSLWINILSLVSESSKNHFSLPLRLVPKAASEHGSQQVTDIQ